MKSSGNAQVCSIKIPSGVYAGDTFNVTLPNTGKEVTVRCPEGLHQGNMMELRVLNTGSVETIVTGSVLDYQVPTTTWREAVCTIIGWVVIDAVLFGLLLAALTVPIMSIQHVSSGCNGAADPSLPPRLYYNLWYGVGTTPDCKQTADEYCIRWSNNKAWSYIDSIAGSTMQYDTNYFTAVQVLFCIATIVTFFALINHVGVGATVASSQSAQATLSLLVDGSAGGTMLFVWALLLISLCLLVYNDQMRESYWQTVWINGFTVPDILNQTPPGVASPVGVCSPHIEMSDGIIITGIATALSFVSGVTLTCCLWAELPRGY